ncbi:hypothetical protein JOF56_003544 [Kibdelosporangium banguiense]|uniref:Uncharacterized protein n=1 Tax=Kibdelosporangium banguiense TaxID=1365924 RepID=A0ABS4TFG3_9PSEU|nr:hypothetical protein [Kibdelosporangium banguiense]MBP2323159.1 hypothetical protein [Kibdelosporangium banguiense]
MVLLEVCNEFELPLPVAQDHDVAALTILAIQMLDTAHDIITCPRDVHLGDEGNLAVILARENNTTIQEGMELAETTAGVVGSLCHSRTAGGSCQDS